MKPSRKCIRTRILNDNSSESTSWYRTIKQCRLNTHNGNQPRHHSSRSQYLYLPHQRILWYSTTYNFKGIRYSLPAFNIQGFLNEHIRDRILPYHLFDERVPSCSTSFLIVSRKQPLSYQCSLQHRIHASYGQR